MLLYTSTTDEATRRGTPLWLHADWFALLIEALLLAIGVAFIYGAGVQIDGDLAHKWYRQLAWIGMGSVIYVVAATVDYHFWARHSWLFYLGGVLLLVVVLVFGKTLNNTKGWLLVPGIGFLQPVELAKPCTLLFLSWLGTRPAMRQSNLGEWLPAIALTLIMLVPVGLICLQPDVGTAMVFFPVTLTLIFLTGFRWRWFFLGFALLALATPLLFLAMKPYQQDRVKVFAEAPAQGLISLVAPVLPETTVTHARESLAKFLAPKAGERKPDDWNAVQSLLAVGSGGFTGKGYLKGTQHLLGYLPRTIATTDFIFSVIAEETGFLGAATLLALLTGLMLCFCKTALLARDRLGTFIAVGAAVIFTTHIVINISMTIKAAPIVGLPLPFVSYGGSFMLGTMLLAGLVQSVELHRRRSHLSFATESDEQENENDI
jgi:rod shape determining protein RodA